MMKSIRTTRAQHTCLRKRFGVTSQMVWYALHYLKNSPKAVEIRKAAIDLGGIYHEEEFTPTCRIEETPEGFRQIFADEVVLEVIITKSLAKISHHGEPILSVRDVTLDGWANLALQAQNLGLEGRFEIPV